MTYKVKLRLPSNTQFAFAETEVSAETIDELELKIAQIQALGHKIGAAETFMNDQFMRGEAGAPAPDHDAAVNLATAALGATVIAPSAPIPQQAAAPAPWERPAPTSSASAPPPWAAAPSAKPGIKLPFGQAGTEQDEKNKQIKSQLKAGGYGVSWNKERKLFEFDSAPPEGVVAWLKSTLPSVGGSYVE